MRNQITTGDVPRFWPPRPSRFWQAVLAPAHWYMLRGMCRIRRLNVAGLDRLQDRIAPEDGALFCPNHSHYSDGAVMMEASRRAWRPFYFMAAWHIFGKHWGLDGWVMQRMGAFSIDREGSDRRAIRQAVELLSTGRSLVIFPEGEIYHLNQRLTPLREGVAFIAATAQRELEKQQRPGRVWMVPAAIHYRYLEDVRPKLAALMTRLEKRMMLTPAAEMSLPQRIIRLGELLLTIKEKEKCGHSFEHLGDLPTRIQHLIQFLLNRLETHHLGASHETEIVPVRVKRLRQHLLERLSDETAAGADAAAARATLEEVHLVLQLFSYPGDYIASCPSQERMAETIDKFEEDMYGWAEPKGPLEATVAFGEPIDVRRQLHSTRPRTAAAELTVTLEEQIKSLMAGLGGSTSAPPVVAERVG